MKVFVLLRSVRIILMMNKLRVSITTPSCSLSYVPWQTINEFSPVFNQRRRQIYMFKGFFYFLFFLRNISKKFEADSEDLSAKVTPYSNSIQLVPGTKKQRPKRLFNDWPQRNLSMMTRIMKMTMMTRWRQRLISKVYANIQWKNNIFYLIVKVVFDRACLYPIF
jgi:hypothetical protein